MLESFKVCCGGIPESLVTVEMQLCSDLLCSLNQAKRVRNEHCNLLDRLLVRDNAVVVEGPGNGQIKDSFAGMDVRDICYPFLIGTFCPELPLQEIGITLFSRVLLPLSRFDGGPAAGCG